MDPYIDILRSHEFIVDNANDNANGDDGNGNANGNDVNENANGNDVNENGIGNDVNDKHQWLSPSTTDRYIIIGIYR
jgi:hypothetical protein